MSDANLPNQTMIDYWNGKAGEKWVRLQDTLDQMLVPPTQALLAKVGELNGKSVLDIGCGTGTTCLHWVAAGAEVTGVDISAPMLALAKQRSDGKVRLVEADASRWQGEANFDVVVSRFGVMFFEDPVAAFANLRSNLAPDGRLVFACWRSPTENAWAYEAMGAVRDLKPEGPAPDPHAPGPFAFADQTRLQGLLTEAGFAQVSIEPFDYQACLAASGGVEAAVGFALQIGPAGAAMADADEATKAIAAERLYAALAPYASNDRVDMPAAIWLVEARLA